MLVLSRKEGETIVIDGGIEIQVASVQGNRVRIAIKAPRDRRILRGEIADELSVPAKHVSEAERVPAVPLNYCI